jgi:hypothetical protein
MSHVLVHDMDSALTVTGAGLTVAVEAASAPGIGGASNRLTGSGAGPATATLASAGLDLGGFDELRFWIIADHAADGSVAHPFFLEVFYEDLTLPGMEFRWFVPVNEANRWEQRTIGLGANPRAQAVRIGFRALPPLSFSCAIDELLAVREEMMLDAEAALVTELERSIALPGLAGIPTSTLPAPGDAQLVLPLTPNFGVGNRIRVTGGSLGDETFDVGAVTDNVPAATTTLGLAGGATIKGAFGGPGLVSVIVPVVAATSAQPAALPTPSVVMTMVDAREALDRTVYFDQRDSFRAAGPVVVVCSVRPAPRAYVMEYQLTIVGDLRPQQLVIHDAVLQRLSGVTGLRINGAIAPVWMLAPPPQFQRRVDELSPAYIRIGTHMQVAPRSEQTWVRHAEVRAAPFDAHADWERVEVEL